MDCSEVSTDGLRVKYDCLMIYHTYMPRPPLSHFVEMLWYYEDDKPPHEKERVLPTGAMEMVINLRDDALRVCDGKNPDQLQNLGSSLVCGAHSGFFVIDTAGQVRSMGVAFKPGGTLPFLALPAGELQDAHVPLDALWDRTAGDSRDRLLAAETVAAKFRVLEEDLLARLARPVVRHSAVVFALEQFQRVPQEHTVSEVTARTGLSPRRFIQLFEQEVGLTPKLFCRVQRFQEALRLCAGEERIGFGELALACGYFDQAHFIRDFQTFSGLSPTAYLKQRSEHLNHVPILN
ncbi:helix-turn-helix domain-containing protein [soil metagenome]